MTVLTDSQLFWECFDPRRTREAGGKSGVLLDNFVSLSMPAGSSCREGVEKISRVAHKPFPIASISNLLDEPRSFRTRIYFGFVGEQIGQIVGNYPDMRWWMAKDGLVIELVPDDADQLSEFDRMAGKLACDGTHAGKLSGDTLKQIAAELDAAGFSLSKYLQPAQWRLIAKFNQNFSKDAVKSFSAAVLDRRFSQTVRRRLYVARDRYRAAYKIICS